jgi:uracil-DNA glycosylase
MSDDDRPGAQQWVPEKPTLKSLRAAAADCRGCELYEDATQVVVSTGSSKASIMLVGEQPGDQEDRAGEPFVGPAGRLLDEALREADIPDQQVYLTNAVKHFRFSYRGTGKRRIHEKPQAAHIDACHPWLEAELALVVPEVVVCLGATAARAVFGRPMPIGRNRGRLLDDPTGRAASGIVITSHPSAVIRQREKEKRQHAFDELVTDLVLAREAAS